MKTYKQLISESKFDFDILDKSTYKKTGKVAINIPGSAPIDALIKQYENDFNCTDVVVTMTSNDVIKVTSVFPGQKTKTNNYYRLRK